MGISPTLLIPGFGYGIPDNGLVYNGVPLVESGVYLIETD